MDGVAVTRTSTVSLREWGTFGLCWLIPAALASFVLLGPGAANPAVLRTAIGISIAVSIVNLVLALLLLLDVWNRSLIVPLVALDTMAALAAMYLLDGRLAWTALVPLVLTGVYFGWSTGLIHGVLVAGALLIMRLVEAQGGAITLEPAALGIAGVFLAAGPLAAMLAQAHALPGDAQKREREIEQRIAAETRRTREIMAVVYDVAEVLGASKLDANRVLDSALNFALDGLKRVGVRQPLSGMILLFDTTGRAGETVLRPVQASSMVLPEDRYVTVPGTSGAIYRALTQFGPVVSHAPDVDPELCQFETFRSCRTALCLPLKAGPDAYGVMLVGSQVVDAFEDLHIEMLWAVANQAAASLNNAKLYASLLAQRDRLVEVENATRAQLAADLHDGPTQGMSAITMRLNYIRRLLDKSPETAVDELYKVEDLARRTTKEIRMMLFELRPKSLEHGLSIGLDQLAKKMLETYNQKVEVHVEDGLDSLLDGQASVTLFSIAIEAMHNARKHARADVIHVFAGVQEGALTLTIQDDGRGFDVDEALAAADEREGHLGLNNLRDRAALLEGTLDIQSAPDEGTRVTVTIPLETLRMRRADEVKRQLASGPHEQPALA